jgi:hypothetical protein
MKNTIYSLLLVLISCSKTYEKPSVFSVSKVLNLDPATGAIKSWNSFYYTKGRLDSTVYFNPNRTHVIYYEYMGAHKRIKRQRLVNEDEYSVELLDNRGNIYECTAYSDGVMLNKTLYEYDEKGRSIKTAQHNRKGDLVAWTQSYYSGNRVDSIVSFNPKRYYVTSFAYASKWQRKSFVSYSKLKIDSSYSIETIVVNDIVGDSKRYSKTGGLVDWYKTEIEVID